MQNFDSSDIHCDGIDCWSARIAQKDLKCAVSRGFCTGIAISLVKVEVE